MIGMNSNLKRFLGYLQFKMECVASQESQRVCLDMPLVLSCIQDLEQQQEEHVEVLKTVMPQVKKMKKINKPKNTHKKDGTLSAYGERWFNRLREEKLSPLTKGPIEVFSHFEEPNPNSVDQVKSWLYSIGWQPCTFKYVREGHKERKIPQVRYSANGHPRKGELTDSVLRLISREPNLKHLEGLTIIQHRLGIFRGFKSASIEEGGQYWLKAGVGGLTNTLRFKHRAPLVNLPGVDKPWGKEVRSCLIATPGKKMVGSDMVSLESTTKRHYIFPLDPTYAEEMSQPGFDEHLDLAVKAGEISQDDYDYYIKFGEDTDKGKELHKIRKKFKPVNYSAIYGIQQPKLSRETGMSKAEATALLKAYWQRNWSVNKVVASLQTKQVNGINWLLNPVSGFWYELRFDKDRFSTLNQGTGVYIFDSWLARCNRLGYSGAFQFHDETGNGHIEDEDKTTEILRKAVEQLNEDLNLNVIIDIDIKYGHNYAEVH